MISIRTKLILFICLSTIVMNALSCTFFLVHEKRQYEEVLKKLGISLVRSIAQDTEVEFALSNSQPAFLDLPIKRTKAFDKDEEIGYWRITTNNMKLLFEEKALWTKIQINEIPIKDTFKDVSIPSISKLSTSSGENFFDFSIPIMKKQIFSEEVFARHVLSNDKAPAEQRHQTIGFVQIGLSTRKLDEKIHAIITGRIIPIVACITFCGIFIGFLINRYIASPLRHIAHVTLDIARGDLSQAIEIRSKDELGQLSMNFNKMTRALNTSYYELKQEIAERKKAEELLEYRVEMEERIAAISTNFINLPVGEVDNGINNALKSIGEFAGIDRSYVFLYSSKGKKMDNTHEWCADGIVPQIQNLKALPVANFPWSMERLKRFEVIHIPKIADLPDNANSEKSILQSQDIKSCIMVPMIYRESLFGFLGFDSVRTEKTWGAQDVTLLKILGEIFVNALEHRRKYEMLQNAHDELDVRVKERTIEFLKTNKRLQDEVVEHKKAREELKKYEILISEITDLPYIYDTNGNILFVNHMFDKLTGRKREEFIGKPFAPLFDDKNLKKAVDVYRKTLKGESPQYELYFKDTGVLCEYKNLPLRNDRGEIIGVIGTARDITERKSMEETHRKANEALNTIIQSSPAAIVVLDNTGRVKMWNPSAERIFGWKVQEVIDRNFPILPEDKSEELRILRERVVRGESFMNIELRRQKKDGSPIDISLSAAPLYDENGKVVSVMGIISDITDRKRIIEALKQAKEYAENLIETANVMVVGLDVNGKIQIFNKSAEEITEYRKSEVIGKNYTDVLVSKDKHSSELYEFNRWLSKREVAKTFESQIITKYGKLKYISWQNSEVNDNGNIVGMISFGNDITEQKRTKELIERIRITSFIKDVGIALTQGNTLKDILKQCVEALVNNLNAAFARIWILNEDRNILELQASSGIYTHIDGLHSKIKIGELKIGNIAKEQKPYLISSLINDPHIDKEWAKNEGIISFAGYPLMVENRLMGVVAMFAKETLTKFTINALASVADIIALGIERKQAEEKLRMSEGKYRMLLENIPQKIFYKDRNLVYVSCNENYASDLKIKPDEIVGKTDYDFFPNILAEKYRADDIRILRTGQTEDIEEKYIVEGREMIINTVKTPIRDEKGNVVGILGIFSDITEKIALQMDAVRSRHLASIGELAAGVAHEINNPITGVINCAQIIADRSNNESKEKDLANKIIKEGKRIASIVSNLLLLARPVERKEGKSKVYIQEILSEVLVITETQLTKENIKIKLNIPHGLPEIVANPQQIQQVFLNIINNARYALNQKYQRKNDNKILEIIGEEVVIDNCQYIKTSFYDCGTGIPANIINKVFDPFFTIKPRGKGTGLGLSISHRIISEHKGLITIDSVEGVFTNVSVILPVFRQV